MRKLFPVVLLTALALILAAPVKADSLCSAGSTCPVLLTQTNVVQLAGVVVTVTIDNSVTNGNGGTFTVLSFQLTTNPLTNTALGLDKVGWTGTAVSTANNWGGGNTAASKSSMDGFGKFTMQGDDPAGTGGISSPVTFTLNSLVTTFPANSLGNEFAVHVRFGSSVGSTAGCSGFIGGQSGTSSADDEPGCVPKPPPPPVPEPSSLALLGTGLVSVAGLIRRRLVK
jgi:hypothetical protein